MSTTHREPPHASPNDESPTAGRRCDHCGAAIETGDWHPVTKRRNPDGSLAFFYFDSEACQDAWLADDGAESTVAIE